MSIDRGSLAERWGRHDRGFAALRRAGRAAIFMPGLFALCDVGFHDVQAALFASFGSYALFLLTDFSGPRRSRVISQISLSLGGAVAVCLGTLASRDAWLATLSMAVVALVVLFTAVVSSTLASCTTALLLAFILPTSIPGSASVIPDRLLGWGLASVASIFAIGLLWPSPNQGALRASSVKALRALSTRLEAEAEWHQASTTTERESAFASRTSATASASEVVHALQQGFLATPWRPTGLSTPSRFLVRLVDELLWLSNVIEDDLQLALAPKVDARARDVRAASATVLRAGADYLEHPRSSPKPLEAAIADLRQRMGEMEQHAVEYVPTPSEETEDGSGRSELDHEAPTELVEAFTATLATDFRAEEVGFITARVGENVLLAAGSSGRRWRDQIAGKTPGDPNGAWVTAKARLASHLERHSVWLHNSVRGAIGLALAVLVAREVGAEHAFWVVLGSLSVLRSNAINTGQSALRAVWGTVVGFVIGAALIDLIGTNHTLLWFLLPVAILIAGIAPTAISFLAGQAAFTIALVILFNLIEPTGWHVGLVRLEDVVIGCAVSIGVGVLLWPRGASASLEHDLDQAYAATAAYLDSAVNFGASCCDNQTQFSTSPSEAAAKAASAARRLDDTFRTFLVERGAKAHTLADVAGAVTGVALLRQSADAIVDLWSVDGERAGGDRTLAKAELSEEAARVAAWYLAYGASFTGATPPSAGEPDDAATRRLVEALHRDLHDHDPRSTETAVKIIWTWHHLEAARRLEASLASASTPHRRVS